MFRKSFFLKKFMWYSWCLRCIFASARRTKYSSTGGILGVFSELNSFINENTRVFNSTRIDYLTCKNGRRHSRQRCHFEYQHLWWIIDIQIGSTTEVAKGRCFAMVGMPVVSRGKHDTGVSGVSSISGPYKHLFQMDILRAANHFRDQDRIGQRFMWQWGVRRIEFNGDFLILVVFVEPDISMLGSEKFWTCISTVSCGIRFGSFFANGQWVSLEAKRGVARWRPHRGSPHCEGSLASRAQWCSGPQHSGLLMKGGELGGEMHIFRSNTCSNSTAVLRR